MGFYGEGSYISEPWNRLDFIVVVTSGVPGVSALRTFRVLRPLKSLNAVPELQKIVKGILRAGAGILDVGVVLLFVFTIFGIMGVNLFGTGGQMHRLCRATPFPVNELDPWRRLLRVRVPPWRTGKQQRPPVHRLGL
jgi:hypothetical protein